MKFFTFCLTLLALSNAAEPTILGQELVVPPQCQNLNVLDPNLSCPPGWMQYGTRQQDVENCGLEHCSDEDRFSQATIQDCANHCAANGCVVFSYAPICGDENHYLEKGETTTVCTIHGPADTQINGDHGPNQIMCIRAPTPSPVPVDIEGPCGEVRKRDANGQLTVNPGATPYGFPGEDVKDCGQLHCMSPDRFNKETIQECFDYCEANNCRVFSWAERGGDENHPNDYVCTTHGSNDITINDDFHGPNQVLCRNLTFLPADFVPLRNIPSTGRMIMAFAQKNTGAILAVVGLLSLFGGIVYKKRQANANSYEEIPVEEV